jgi:hypothetical protein
VSEKGDHEFGVFLLPVKWVREKGGHAFGFFLLPVKLKILKKARESTATTNKQTNKQTKDCCIGDETQHKG